MENTAEGVTFYVEVWVDGQSLPIAEGSRLLVQIAACDGSTNQPMLTIDTRATDQTIWLVLADYANRESLRNIVLPRRKEQSADA